MTHVKEILLDEFGDISGWMAIASGQVQAKLSRDEGPGGGALRMDFDFKGGGGFAVARKEFTRRLPEAFAFRFRIRGRAPANIFEFKLVDPSGKNVWRHRREAFAVAEEWQEIRLRTSQIEFGWGPAGGGAIRRLGAIEFVVAAGPGGKGSIWIEDLRLEDLTPAHPPKVTASSEAKGRGANHVTRAKGARSWRPLPSDRRPCLQLDFGQEREYGGLVIDWERGCRIRTFDIQDSGDGVRWRTIESIARSEGERSHIRLPGGASRFLRLAFRRAGAAGTLGVRHIAVKPFDFGRSEAEFLHSVAAMGSRGLFPRYLYREQSYWTCAGIASANTRALINEEGLVEVDEGSFSLEPFLYVGDRLITWADARVSQELEEGSLPIPSSIWRVGDMTLRVTACADGRPGDAALFVRYRIEDSARRHRRARLFVAVRPFQVTPPWQSWKHLGGVSPIRELRWRSGAAWVNGGKPVVPLSRPSGFGAVAFHQGPITDRFARGIVPFPKHVKDPTGLASGALRFDVDLGPSRAAEVIVAIPLGPGAGNEPARLRDLARRFRERDPFAAAALRWQLKLSATGFRLPRDAGAAGGAFRTSAGQILINCDGPAIQPGPRRYTRSWIRDGAIMSAALLRAGCDNEVRDFIRWYAPYQRDDGFVPCCVDRTGPDWLVEHDSHGQLIYAVAEYFRFTRDREFLQTMWPAVQKACGIIETLRGQRLGPEFESPERRACRGLLPESASHEGYLAHPVHSYWDDFWAIRGLKDASSIARVLGHESEAGRLARLAEDLRRSVRASLETVISARGIDYIPGSVEWADFDPTATANAISLLHGAVYMPAAPLDNMFARYIADFRKKHGGQMEWNNYSAYEIRIVGALARLGRRDDALELLRFFLSDRRPRAWNQWPEISWRDPRSPGHIGDVPHTWIGAEYMLAFHSLFAFESEADDSLVVGAGIDPAWAEAKGGVAVEGLRTWHGSLNLEISRGRAGALRVCLGGRIEMPRGGIVLHASVRDRISRVHVNGRVAAPAPDGRTIAIREFPAEILLDSTTT